MYSEESVATPRDVDHFWELIDENIGHLRMIFDARIESEEEALAGTFREGANNRLTAMMMIAHSGTSEYNDMRYYFHFVGKEAMTIVERGFSERKLSIEFCQAWGVAQCAHGYLAAHLALDIDLFKSQRGAIKNGRAISVDLKRVWVSKIILSEMQNGLSRDQAEMKVEKVIRGFVEIGGFGRAFPVAWFEDLIHNGMLKKTYRTQKLYKKIMVELIDKNASAEIPPLAPPGAPGG